MQLSVQRAAQRWLLVAALLAVSATARPVPQLAEPDYTLYHTMCVGGALAPRGSCRCRRRRRLHVPAASGQARPAVAHAALVQRGAGTPCSRRCGRSWRAAPQP